MIAPWQTRQIIVCGNPRDRPCRFLSCCRLISPLAVGWRGRRSDVASWLLQHDPPHTGNIKRRRRGPKECRNIPLRTWNSKRSARFTTLHPFHMFCLSVWRTWGFSQIYCSKADSDSLVCPYDYERVGPDWVRDATRTLASMQIQFTVDATMCIYRSTPSPTVDATGKVL